MPIRTFVAVKASRRVQNRIEGLIASLRQSGVKTTWVRPENLHLTLKFLGDVDEQRIPRVCQAVDRALADVDSFPLHFSGVGAFPSARRPRTVWIGVTEGNDDVCKLAAALETQLRAEGFPKEKRDFAPHLTIGRVRGHPVTELARRIEQHADFDAGQSPVTEVVVYSSTLAPTGATYEAMHRAQLGA
jgi:2'-5' RNA ligase